MGFAPSERVLRHASYGTVLKQGLLTPSKSAAERDLYSTQAVLKGGIGEYVSQGLSKRGQNENPNSMFYTPGCSQATLRNVLQQKQGAPDQCPMH